MARRLLALAMAASLLTGCGVVSALGGDPAAGAADSTTPTIFDRWLSGAAGIGVPSGEFGAWRGSPVEIASTWADNNDAMTHLAQLRPGGEYAAWSGPLDIAIGAIGPGESWEEAARGAYDERWRQSLATLRQLRGPGAGTTFVRFAHEMNGDWYPWAVNAGNYRAFIEAWRRFRGLQRELFPQARLVFGVNRESVNAGMDWRDMFPGAGYVDAMAVDYYNHTPCIETAQDWDLTVDEVDGFGGPRGLEQHRRFAEEVGLPLAVPEWAGKADECESPVYVRRMHDYFLAHAGDGPGGLLYEGYFNVDWEGASWRVYPSDRMPLPAEEYRALF
jgi:hypothetical protein